MNTVRYIQNVVNPLFINNSRPSREPTVHVNKNFFTGCLVDCPDATPYCYTVKTYTSDKKIIYIDRGCAAVDNNNFNDFDNTPSTLNKEVCTVRYQHKIM